jgi:hypothetical protein
MNYYTLKKFIDETGDITKDPSNIVFYDVSAIKQDFERVFPFNTMEDFIYSHFTRNNEEIVYYFRDSKNNFSSLWVGKNYHDINNYKFKNVNKYEMYSSSNLYNLKQFLKDSDIHDKHEVQFYINKFNINN